MINLGRFKEAAAIYGQVVAKARWLVLVDPNDIKAQVDLSFGLLRSAIRSCRPVSRRRVCGR